MNRHHLIFSSFWLLLLVGCVSKQAQQYNHFNEQAILAESYNQSGQHKQAADLFQSLSRSQPNQQHYYQLLAAKAHLQSGNNQAAETLLKNIDPATLSAELRSLFYLLKAQVSLSYGEAEQALVQLKMTEVSSLSDADQIIYYQSLAFDYSLTGNILESAMARINLSALLQDEQQINENNRVILNTLSLLPADTLSAEQSSSSEQLAGWLALTKIVKDSRLDSNSENLRIRLQHWQTLFPYHPANSDFLISLLEGRKHNFIIPTAIALLLPETGRYAQAGNAIKQGFIAAYQNSHSSFQPPFRFYDSNADDVVNLYHLAISEGAELIIGPLIKNNIKHLVENTELKVPVLALNHIPNLAKDNLIQFGLSPIDDSIQITRLANDQGFNKALLISADNGQGQRIAQRITEYWESTGGIILEQQFYNPKETDFSWPIKKLLNLDESKQRYNKLKHFLATNIQFAERRRHDVDNIFMFAYPKTGRSLYPQLLFYRASHVPVYATSHIFSGYPNPALDIDLNDVNFCDLPWLFPEVYPGDLSMNALQDIWQQIPRRYIRLLALGLDAFNVIPALNQLDTTAFPGATGMLSLNRENRITRQLVCAKFIEGKPVIQNYTALQPTNIEEQENNHPYKLNP